MAAPPKSLSGQPWWARRTSRGARAASAATTDEACLKARRRREERARRSQPPDRSPQPPWLPGQPPKLLLPPVRRIAPLVARPRPHSGAPVDEPRRRAPLEVRAGTRRELDEGEPGEVGARERAHEVLALAAHRPRLELAELPADLRSRRLDRRRVALVGRREEDVPREREEALREVEQALELLDADPGPLGRVGRQERRARVALLQVLDDRARLVERDAVVLERRHLAVRAARQVRGRLVLALLEAQQHGLVGEPLLLERELHAPREGRARAVVEADHRGPPSP